MRFPLKRVVGRKKKSIYQMGSPRSGEVEEEEFMQRSQMNIGVFVPD